MIACQIDPKQIQALKDSLKSKASRLPREIATAINATAKDVRIEVARALRKEMNPKTKISTIKKTIKAKSSATKDQLIAIVRLAKGHPFPMKFFSPRQTKKGVNVKFGRVKGKAGKTFFPHAFIVNRYGGNVYERTSKGRGPLKQLKGPSPGEFFEQAGIHQLAWKVARRQLPIQMQRRIRFLMLQSSGGLRGNSSGRKGRGNQ